MAKQIIRNKNKVKSFKRVDFQERIIIETRYCRDKKSISDTAKELERPICTIVREIGGRPRIGRGKYSADSKQKKALLNYEKQGRKRKMTYEPLHDYVVGKLKLGWSPEQIEIRLPIEYKNDLKMRISYEAIYEYIYNQVYRTGNGYVKPNCEDLRVYLARRHNRRQKKGFRKAQRLEKMTSLPSIDTRPKEVEKRQSVGHWEGDTMVSRESEVRIKSVNERVTGVVFFGKTINGTAIECDKVLVNKLSSIPIEIRKTLTQDRGTENFGYKYVEMQLKISCYFAHAYSSYERGSNENTNGLFRRYFPKGTDFAKVSDEDIKWVEYLINTRPRKRFAGLTPLEVLYNKTGVAIEY